MRDSRAHSFKAIDREWSGNISERVVAQFGEMIRRGELRPGDRLPPERDLAESLGISRPTLRAGVASLVKLGFLRSRRGAGTFVIDAEGPFLIDDNPLRLMALLFDFAKPEKFEARESLEMTIVGLAAKGATSVQLALISDELTEMFAARDEPERFLNHDIRFHQ